VSLFAKKKQEIKRHQA